MALSFSEFDIRDTLLAPVGHIDKHIGSGVEIENLKRYGCQGRGRKIIGSHSPNKIEYSTRSSKTGTVAAKSTKLSMSQKDKSRPKKRHFTAKTPVNFV